MIEEYSLDLSVDFESAFITGSVGIRAKGLDNNALEVDVKELEIRAVSINGQTVPFEHDKAKDLLIIREIPEEGSEVLINIDYQKQIQDSASTGVYKCRNGSDYFIITDFEPDRARTFFPCKDHPLWKAVFNVSVTTSKDLKVISNSPIKAVEAIDEARSRFIFDPTPKMSTYLLFVGIGRFAETSLPDSEGIRVSVASRREVSDKCDFVLGIARRALEESGDYFGVPYPLPKLHIIGLTEYNGAMENWGPSPPPKSLLYSMRRRAPSSIGREPLSSRSTRSSTSGSETW